MLHIVVILFHSADAAPLLWACLQAQNFAGWRMVVIDNGAADGAGSFLAAQDDPRLLPSDNPDIRLFRFKTEKLMMKHINMISEKYVPSVTAIICTRNRSSSLKRALVSMSALKLSRLNQFELLVIDNGSTDDTKEVIIDFAENAPFPVVCLSESQPGLSFARNRGLSIATGDLIMFTDDDCLVAPDWVQSALKIFNNNTWKIVSGRVELFDKNQLSPIIRLGTERETLNCLDFLFGFIHGANMSFGRAIVDSIGLFDVRLGAGTPLRSAEDTEFIYRAFIHGVPIIYEPAVLVLHDHGHIGIRNNYEQQREYLIGIGAMTTKHLLAGRINLVKPVYWMCHSALRKWFLNATFWCPPPAIHALLIGAIRYLVQASWKKPT